MQLAIEERPIEPLISEENENKVTDRTPKPQTGPLIKEILNSEHNMMNLLFIPSTSFHYVFSIQSSKITYDMQVTLA